MKLACFDLGTTWALATNQPLGEALTSPLAQAYHHTLIGGNRIAKLIGFRKILELNVRWEDYDFVVYERPFARGQAATRMLWGMAGIIESVCGEHCGILDFTPAEIKKWATGYGNASKDAMGLAAAVRLGYTGNNEHEADAYCLLKFSEANLHVEGPSNG